MPPNKRRLSPTGQAANITLRFSASEHHFCHSERSGGISKFKVEIARDVLVRAGLAYSLGMTKQDRRPAIFTCADAGRRVSRVADMTRGDR